MACFGTVQGPMWRFLASSGGGFTLPQVYCVRLGPGTAKPSVEFTDDVIFASSKRKLFQVVVLLESLDQYAQARDGLANLDELSNGELLASEATFIVHNMELRQRSTKGLVNVYRVAAAQEFAADSDLCGRRPSPLYYDELRMMREAKGMRFLILRPDWIVFAASATPRELERSAVALGAFTKAF